MLPIKRLAVTTFSDKMTQKMNWIEFLNVRLAHIFLIYGLSFFVLGLAVALEIGRIEPTCFSRSMWPLAFFGLVHGSHEWVEMFVIIGRDAYGFQPAAGFEIFRLLLLAVSFAALIAFGGQVVRLPQKLSQQSGLILGLSMLLLYGLGVVLIGQKLNWQQPEWFAAADVLARYGLAIPGAILTASALLVQRQTLMRATGNIFANDLLWVAMAFLLYGLVGQFFVKASPLFPSNLVNAQTFQNWFGFPIQLFRAIIAGIAAIFTIRTLRAFEYNRQQKLAAVRRRVQEEISRRDALRQEFLQRIVETQEEERTRIARELHDELGQVLTGLAVGLRGVQTSVADPKLHQQLSVLKEMATQALDDMRHLVNELRPALLDDMGLPAALHHYVNNFAALTGIETSLNLYATCDELSNSIKTTLFRILQESLTNVARHAQATQAWIDMSCDERQVILQIKDNGVGFDPVEVLGSETHPAWGLMGIQERAKLVNGKVEFRAEVGKGATVMVAVPKNRET
jgi:signal transduction histidine kinase